MKPLFSRTSGNTLSVLSLLCMAAIIGGLLVVNYYSQNISQQANIRRFQQNLEDHARGLSYFFSERENDIRELSLSPVVHSFFANRAMGMSMQYGLRASLHAIGRLFKQQVDACQLGGIAIYTGLYLFDKDGQLLASIGQSQPPAATMQPGRESGQVTMTSHAEGVVSFAAPVLQNEVVQGYVHGYLNYQTVMNYLVSDLHGRVFVIDGERLAYRSHEDLALLTSEVGQLTASKTSPAPLPGKALASAAGQNMDQHRFSVFFTTIPGSAASIYLLENQTTIDRRQAQLVFMTSLIVLSAGAFVVALLVFRAGARNLILETSLSEAAIREKAVAEKAAELELVIDGAGLGTWSWNVQTGECQFNRQWLQMLGYAKEDIAPNVASWEDLLHPDDKEQVQAAVDKHLQGLTDFYFTEHRLRHASGRWIWVHDSGKVLQRNAQGQPLRAFGIHLDITERREASQLLRRAKEESDSIIRNFLDTMIVVDTSLRISRVNQATCQLLGYDETRLLGMDIRNLFHDDASQIEQIFTFYQHPNAANVGAPELRNVELCYRHADGGRLPMSFNLNLLEDEGGEILGVVAGAKDISALRQVLDELSRQKEYIETLFDIVPEGLLAISPDNHIVRSNHAFKSMLALWSQQLAISEAELSRQFITKIEQQHIGGEYSFTLSLRVADQSFYCKCHSVPISVLDGIAYVIAVDDITTERHIQEEKKLLATVIEQTSDSVLITDTAKTIIYANSAVEQNTGYRLAELLGQTPVLFKSGQTDPAVYADLYASLAQSKGWSGRMRNRRKNGTIVEEDVRISPVRNEDGELTHYVAIKRDMTEMTNLQRQLMQSQKLEAIGQLAAGIAHEINTPMQYVQNNVTFFGQAFQDAVPLFTELQKIHTGQPALNLMQLLDELDLSFVLEEIPEALAEAHEGIARVVKIVSAMKAFSHPGSGSKGATDLNQALESTLTVCRNEYKYLAELVTNFDPELPLVPCFPDQFNQAILNLIINAAHAIEATGASLPEKPGRITVSTRHSGDWAEIRVQDTGGGIPEAIRPCIYDPFFTTKEVGKGTGQGLTIVHDIIVQKHGGSIDFISEEGRGTTFILRLPLTA